ncbi:MAG TPA: ribosome silencing factor [Candidatus Ozemobacteraceae bacterium]|nr:ribosome silencing factor [Candidatus Ozemobacteraceae bacterium]
MTETTKKNTRKTGTAKTTAKTAGTKNPAVAKKPAASKKAASTAGSTGPVKRTRSAAVAKGVAAIKPPRRKVAPKSRSEERLSTPRKASSHHLPELLRNVLKALSDKKVVDPVLLDVEGLVSYADYFVLGTGNNTPHVQAMADAVARLLKVPGVKGARVEGDSQASWVLIDGGDFVVHLFQPDARRFYALDDLWGDAARIPVES